MAKLAPGDVMTETRKFDGALTIYFRDWAGTLRADRTTYFNHRHELTYHKAGKRKGCSYCLCAPPDELKALLGLQKLRAARGGISDGVSSGG